LPLQTTGWRPGNDIVKSLLGRDGKKERLVPLELCTRLLGVMRSMSMRSSDPVPENALATEGLSSYATKKYI
jgi:hypothetical protein